MSQGLPAGGAVLTRVRRDYVSPATLSGLPPETPVLLALSGGADSRLLLHLLSEDCQTSGAPLYLCHLNHGIRGAEADRDEAFCRALAEQYGLPIFVERADVPALAKARGLSEEAVGRDCRYDFFARRMEEHSIPILATAHHADDNLETVLFRLLRGCGTAGLGAIAPRRPLAGRESAEAGACPVVTRPLLRLSKADILAACAALGLDYVTDSTNADVGHPRNALRARVIPALRDITPHPERQALRLSAAAREDEDCLCSMAEELLSRHLAGTALSCAVLTAAHPAIAKRALLHWCDRLGCPAEQKHLEALLALCHQGKGGAHLPGGLCAAVDRGYLTLTVGPALRDRRPRCDWTPVPLTPGTARLAEAGVEMVLCDGKDWLQHQKITKKTKNVYNPFIRDTLRFDTILGCAELCRTRPMVWRPRRPGEVIRRGGHTRLLRKLQNQIGLSPELRERLPLLCDAVTDQVLWAPFIGPADEAFPPMEGGGEVVLTLTVI